MQIERIHNYGYDKRGFAWDGRRKGQSAKKNVHLPIDAVTISADAAPQTKHSPSDNYSWLNSYIKSLPEEEVMDRIKSVIHSFDTIEDCLAEKLLMEEL